MSSQSWHRLLITMIDEITLFPTTGGNFRQRRRRKGNTVIKFI